MSTFKLTRSEFEFMLNHVPAFGSLSPKDREIYIRLMGMMASKPSIQKFYFPYKQNVDMGMSVPVIKVLRAIFGFSLKEAKDAYDKEARFTLSDAKTTKEGLLQMCGSLNSYTGSKGIIVEFE